MAYKYSKGVTIQGDIKAADDTQRDTLIDFGEDQIDLQTSGTVRLQVTNNGVYIPDTAADTTLRVSGAVEITPGHNAGITFKKSESEINFIKFANDVMLAGFSDWFTILDLDPVTLANNCNGV